MADFTDVEMKPKVVNWIWPRGDTWYFPFSFTDEEPVPTGLDLTGSTWLMQIRYKSSDGPVLTTVTIDTTQQNVGNLIGRVAPSVTATALTDHHYVYDLQQTLGSDKATPIAGIIQVTPDVSRP